MKIRVRNMKHIKVSILISKNDNIYLYYILEDYFIFLFKDFLNKVHHGKLKNSDVFYIIFIELLKTVCYVSIIFSNIIENFNLVPKGVITFQRFALPNHMIPNWMVSQATPCKIHMVQNATIEDMHGLLQVDFANMFIVSKNNLFGGFLIEEFDRVVVL